jgi:hypothetical protein
VRSVDNLGQLGDRPSHSALLDRLARDAVGDGWSCKRLIRRIALSSTYAMASVDADPRAAAADPDNALLHRQNLRRLEAEPLRDALLAFGDRLDERRFGPPVPVPLADGENARGKPAVAGPADGRGRRSIYLAVPRNFLDEFLLAFDLPTPFATVGARNVSNVPAQSLALFNDPFVQGMSRLAAEHLFAAGPSSPRARLDRLFLTAFARPATDDEAGPCLQFVAEAAAGGPDPVAPWAALAHVLVNRKEFQFLQ